MDFSFIHISDIHLGRQFSDLSEYSFDEKIKNLYKNAVEKSLKNAVNYAIDNKVDFVLIAGDTFDSGNHDFSSKLILKKYLQELDNCGIKVFLICGNHDPVNSYNKNTFNYDENSGIKIIGFNTPINGKFPFIDNNGELRAYIHALSFQNKNFNENPIKYFDYLTDDDKKVFNIGLLHCDLDGDKLSPYAPCSSSDLKSLNYNYWALGHIHIPKEIENNIIYSGTIQSRNTKETGFHGIRHIKVQNNNIVENVFVPVNTVRYEDINIDISMFDDDTRCLDSIIDEIRTLTLDTNCELFLIKITILGITSFYENINDKFYEQLFEQVKKEFQGKVYISQIKNLVEQKANEEALKNDDGIVGELYKSLTDESTLNSFYTEAVNSFEKLIRDCEYNDEEINEFKASVIKDVRQKGINICSKLYNSGGIED